MCSTKVQKLVWQSPGAPEDSEKSSNDCISPNAQTVTIARFRGRGIPIISKHLCNQFACILREPRGDCPVRASCGSSVQGNHSFNSFRPASSLTDCCQEWGRP